MDIDHDRGNAVSYGIFDVLSIAEVTGKPLQATINRLDRYRRACDGESEKELTKCLEAITQAMEVYANTLS
jgi:hypothetical protein